MLEKADSLQKVTAAVMAPRLDRWLRRRFGPINQGLIERLLKEGKIRVNGQKVKASHRIEDEEKVEINYDFGTPENFDDNGIRIGGPSYRNQVSQDCYSSKDLLFFQECILFEDDELLVLNKPNGLATQGGSNISYHVDGLAVHYAKIRRFKEKPRLVHRLDKDTSGVLVLAKTLAVAQRLQELFAKNQINKTYWAICEGRLAEEGIIDLPLIKDYDHAIEKMVVDLKKGKNAVTHYRVLGRTSKVMVVELKPQTGRTHQLRVHMQAMGCSILGDGKYGTSCGDKPLHLHAREIQFTLDRFPLAFVAPAPSYMEDIMSKFSFIAN